MIIGAGGVATVVAHKVASHPEIFSEVMIASRTQSKCDAIIKSLEQRGLKKAQWESAKVDADNVPGLTALMEKFKPELVINVALPYQDLQTNYLDTANYEPLDEAKYQYSWQWAYHDRFKEAGLTAILGCGFDPGVTSVFTAYAAKHHFDELRYLDIVDCNAGDHGKAFATNFNPEINIREITQRGKYWEDGQWHETDPLSVHKALNYPHIGPKESYLMYHEELESLVKHYPTLKRARFWMTFGQEYLTHLRVIQDIGMARIDPIDYEGHKIVPIQFLKAVLPNPGELGANYKGWTSIGWQPRDSLQGNRHPRRKLHHRRSGHRRLDDVPQRTLEETRSIQRGRVRPRSVPASARPGRVAVGGNHQWRPRTIKGILRGIYFVAILVQAGHVHQYTPGLDIQSTPRICSCRIPFTLQARQQIASPCTLPVLTQQHLTIEDIESIPAPAEYLLLYRQGKKSHRLAPCPF